MNLLPRYFSSATQKNTLHSLNTESQSPDCASLTRKLQVTTSHQVYRPSDTRAETYDGRVSRKLQVTTSHQVYRPSDTRAETYDGHVEALLIHHNCIAEWLLYSLRSSLSLSISILRFWSASFLANKHLHCVSKKQDTKLLPITSPNVNRFSKFYHWQTQW